MLKSLLDVAGSAEDLGRIKNQIWKCSEHPHDVILMPCSQTPDSWLFPQFLVAVLQDETVDARDHLQPLVPLFAPGVGAEPFANGHSYRRFVFLLCLVSSSS